MCHAVNEATSSTDMIFCSASFEWCNKMRKIECPSARSQQLQMMKHMNHRISDLDGDDIRRCRRTQFGRRNIFLKSSGKQKIFLRIITRRDFLQVRHHGSRACSGPSVSCVRSRNNRSRASFCRHRYRAPHIDWPNRTQSLTAG